MLMTPAGSKPSQSVPFPSTTEGKVCHAELLQEALNSPRAQDKTEPCTSLNVQEHLRRKLSNMPQIWIKIPIFQGYSYHIPTLNSKVTFLILVRSFPFSPCLKEQTQGPLPSSSLQTRLLPLLPQLSLDVFRHPWLAGDWGFPERKTPH